jgi:hypothetical protein
LGYAPREKWSFSYPAHLTLSHGGPGPGLAWQKNLTAFVFDLLNRTSQPVDYRVFGFSKLLLPQFFFFQNGGQHLSLCMYIRLFINLSVISDKAADFWVDYLD